MHPIFERLAAYAHEPDESYELLCRAQGIERMAVGFRPPVAFICTEDIDGQVELSLTKYVRGKRPGEKPQRCTKANADAFLRAIEVAPVEETRGRTTRHFVIQVGGYVH